jgi:hypothetical protein
VGEMTEDRVRVIVNECLATYEAVIGTVRHKENKEALDKTNISLTGLKSTMDKLAGSWDAIKIMGAVIGFLLSFILGILVYFATHRQNQSMVSHQDQTLSVSDPSNAGIY